jgi:hypothetical protein
MAFKSVLLVTFIGGIIMFMQFPKSFVFFSLYHIVVVVKYMNEYINQMGFSGFFSLSMQKSTQTTVGKSLGENVACLLFHGICVIELSRMHP